MHDDEAGHSHQLGLFGRRCPGIRHIGCYAFELLRRIRSHCVSQAQHIAPPNVLTLSRGLFTYTAINSLIFFTKVISGGRWVPPDADMAEYWTCKVSQFLNRPWSED